MWIRSATIAHHNRSYIHTQIKKKMNVQKFDNHCNIANMHATLWINATSVLLNPINTPNPIVLQFKYTPNDKKKLHSKTTSLLCRLLDSWFSSACPAQVEWSRPTGVPTLVYSLNTGFCIGSEAGPQGLYSTPYNLYLCRLFCLTLKRDRLNARAYRNIVLES
jgi:hypothetical protein